MGALSDADLAYIEDELKVPDRRPQMGNPTKAPPVYDPPFKFDPKAEDLGAMNMLRMIGNTPYSTLQVAEAYVDAGADPLKIGETILSAIAGTGELAGYELGLNRETERAQLARQIGSFFYERYSNPTKTIVEDPAGSLLDLSALGTSTGIRSLARGTNPARLTGEAIAGTTTGGAKAAQFAGEQAAGFTTGFEPRQFGRMAESARESRRSVSVPMLREQVGAMRVLDSFEDAVSTVKTNRRNAYQAQLPKLKIADAANPPSLKSIRAKVITQLRDDYDIGLDFSEAIPKLDFTASTISTTGPQRRVERLIKELYTWSDETPRGMDKLKQRVGEFHEDGSRFATSNTIIDKTYDTIKDQLVERVSGYEKLVGDYEQASTALKLFRRSLSHGADNPETTLNKLIGILKDSPTSELRTIIVGELERMGGQPLIDQIAGLSLSQAAPKALIGRAAAAGAVSGLGLAFTGGDLIGLSAGLAFLPFTSPRIMGELFSVLGVAQRQADHIERFVAKVWERLPANAAVEGLTLGAAVQKALMTSQPPEAPMSGLEGATAKPSSTLSTK